MRSFHLPRNQTPGRFSGHRKGAAFFATQNRTGKRPSGRKNLIQRRPPRRLLRFSFICSSDSLLSEVAMNCLS